MTAMTTSGDGGRPGRERAFVGAAWLLIAVCAVIWLATDRRPPEWDYANHLERAVACAHDLAAGDWRTILERSSFYPPLVPCAAGVVYRVLPTDAAAGAIVMLVFLGVGMAATYALARALADGTAGVGAAVIFGTAPFVVFSVLRFQLDLPLAAVVAVALLALVRTEGLTRVGWSLLAGLVFGIGMLTKPSFVAYLWPPVVSLLLRERHRRAIANAVLMVLVAAAIGVAWYGPRLVGMPGQIALRAVTHGAEEGKPPTLSGTALAFYPTWLPTELGVLATALLAAGIVLALLYRQPFAVVAVVVPFVSFMLLRNKDLRYTLPTLPAAAALGGIAIAALPRRVRHAGIAVLVLVGILQVSAVAWGTPPAIPLPGLEVPWVLPSAPVRADWRQREFLRAIVQDRAGRPATVSIVPNHEYFSVSNFRYYAVRDELPLKLTRPWDGEPLGIDYMILKTGSQGPDFTEAKSRRVVERLARDPALARAYPVIAELPLPDGSSGVLRARRIGEAAASPEAVARTLEAAMRRRVDEVARGVDGLAIELTHDADIVRGRVRRVEVTARTAAVGELRKPTAPTLRVQNLRFVAEDVLFNPYALEQGRAELLDVGRFRLERLEVGEADLQTFVAAAKGFGGTRVQLRPGAIDLRISQLGPDIEARVHVVPAGDRPFAIAVERARVAGVPLPRLLVDWVARNYDPTGRIASRLAFPVEIARVSVSERAIRVGD